MGELTREVRDARRLADAEAERDRFRDECIRRGKLLDAICGPPLTPEQAEEAMGNLPELDEAERAALGAIDIEKIIAYAKDPANMSPEEAMRRMIAAAAATPGFPADVLGEVESWLGRRFS